MGFKSSLAFRYSTTHENRAWNKLKGLLEQEWLGREQELLLIGNIVVAGKEIDAMVIKEDALIVIDFKDCGGQLQVSANGPWFAAGKEINSGRKNPFLQLSDNKYAVLGQLKQSLPEGYKNWINIGHINAQVLFHQEIDYDIELLPAELGHGVSKWFGVCDFGNVVTTVDDIVSSETSIRSGRERQILEALGYPTLDFDDSAQESEEIDRLEHNDVGQPTKVNEFTRVEKAEAATLNSQIPKVDNASFSDLYYSTAKALSRINILIVGQDPYPTNANGVAFCKNSYYEQFLEDCSGGRVLLALGITKEIARGMARKNPKNLFFRLLNDCGICFTNMIDVPMDQLSVEQVEAEIRKAQSRNFPLLQTSKLVVVLGKGTAKRLFAEYYPDYEPDLTLIHPSLRARSGSEAEWDSTWGNPGALESLMLNER